MINKLKIDKKILILIFLTPILLILFFIFTKIFLSNVYSTIIREDHVLEYLQVILYFISSILTLYISVAFLKSRRYSFGIIYLILFFILMFWFFEEMNWGQRIFNIPNSEYFETHNAQKEISIHNLNIFQDFLDEAYMIIGFYGAFACFLIPKYFKNKFKEKLKFIVPDWYLSLYFFPIFMIYLFFGYISPYMTHYYEIDIFRIDSIIIWRDQEPAELILSIGLVIFFTIGSFRVKNGKLPLSPHNKKQQNRNNAKQ